MKMVLDPTGHYPRPDVVRLIVDERPRGIVFDKWLFFSLDLTPPS